MRGLHGVTLRTGMISRVRVSTTFWREKNHASSHTLYRSRGRSRNKLVLYSYLLLIKPYSFVLQRDILLEPLAVHEKSAG